MNFKSIYPATALASAMTGLSTAVVISIATPASAFSPVSFGYSCITNNNATDCATGQNQFRTTVSQNGMNTNQVLFQFTNVGPLLSSITQIYFDDTGPFSLLNLDRIINSDGVNFSTTSPGPNKLPGGNTINFTADYMAGSTSPVQPNGINSGEVLGIVFNIRSGFADPINAVITDLQNGSLRIGLHAQGFSDGGSESFVNEAVPEPMTILGTGAAIGMGALLKRKSAKLKKEKSQVS